LPHPDTILFYIINVNNDAAHHNSPTAFYYEESTMKKRILQTALLCMTLILSSSLLSASVVAETVNLPYIGFNAQGSVNVVEQTEYLASMLSQIREEGCNTSKVWIRLQGGTLSQKTYPSDWTDDMIHAWFVVQQTYGCHFIFVINMNDSAESQAAFYERMEYAGLQFSAIEIGNEQYLSKYTGENGNEFKEVTDRTSNMTVAEYVKLSNEYIDLLNQKFLPFMIQFAPNINSYDKNRSWTAAMANAINTGCFHSNNLCGTLHLYESQKLSDLDVSQINAIRKMVNSAFQIAITEYGILDVKEIPEENYIRRDMDLTNRILPQLKPGDILLNQVLYTNYRFVGAAVLHSQYQGLTPKGKILIQKFSDFWK
jgi:hypothetical protein